MASRPLRSLNKYFFRYKYKFVAGIVFVILANIFSIYGAVYVRKAFDEVAIFIKQQKHDVLSSELSVILLQYAGIILLTAAIRGFFMFFMRQTLIVISRNIEYDLKNDIYKHYQKLDAKFYNKNRTGDMMNRISEDVGRIRMYVGPAIMYFVNLLVTFIVVMSSMFSVNITLTLYVLAPLPLISIAIYFINNVIEKRSDDLQNSLGNLTSFVQETFSGLRLIKAYAKEKDFERAFSTEATTLKGNAMSLAKVDAWWFPLILFLVGMSSTFTIYMGGKMAIAGEVTVGNIAEFIIYINMLMFPVAMVGWVTSITQRAIASIKRINEFQLSKSAIVDEENAVDFLFKKSIEFKNISFSYNENDIYSLNDISFKIEKGKSLGITGLTGSGKTTVANLLMRIYDPSKGEILIDETNLKHIKLNNYRKEIGYVPQDVFLFSDTIENNILFGTEETYDEEKVLAAAKYAALYDNIKQFPEGFKTIIGERGITLSGGQKQRLAIARALIRDANILVFDDCLSAVDTETEAKILSSIFDLKKYKTSVIISHRISAIMNCDEIIVLTKGKITERGTHIELMQQNETYKKLYIKQNSGQ